MTERREQLAALHDRCQDALSMKLNATTRAKIEKIAQGVAKALKGEGGARRFGYKAYPISLRLSDLAQKAAYDLGIPEPKVFYIRPCEDGEEPDFTRSRPIAGLCKHNEGGPCDVYILDSLNLFQEAEVLGHEMEHAKQFAAGTFAGCSKDELEADVYGAKFRDAVIYGTRL